MSGTRAIGDCGTSHSGRRRQRPLRHVGPCGAARRHWPGVGATTTRSGTGVSEKRIGLIPLLAIPNKDDPSRTRPECCWSI
jgi:hypothetical protein